MAFESYFTNLVPGDTNKSLDIFVHDRLVGRTTRASVNLDGVQGNNLSRAAGISADGRWVVFSSAATNLVPDDINGVYDIFIHDRYTASTSLASVSTIGTQGNGDSWFPAVSADGRWTVFTSRASNLVPGDTNGFADVFVHDRQTHSTRRVSVDSVGAQGNNYSPYAVSSISADGRYASFLSHASNLVPNDTNGSVDVFVHDTLTGTTSRVSVGPAGAQGNSHSASPPSISHDGRFVAFGSAASNLVSGDTNGVPDAFLHDRENGETTLISVSSQGIQGNNTSPVNACSISFTGRYIAFDSDASNLVSADTNMRSDVFVHDRQIASSPRQPPLYLKGSVFLGRTTPGIPLANVDIQLLDPDTRSVIATVQTNSTGDYVLSGPLTADYYLRAKLTYIDPALNQQRDVFAYLNNNPDELVGPNYPQLLPALFFDWPIILQSGWLGSAGRTWTTAIEFLISDPGDSSSPAWPLKKDRRLPSFLCFPMPNSFEVTGGYNNTGWLNHDTNAERLRYWIETDVKAALVPWHVQSRWDDVHFFLIGHSMGGIIARALATSSFSPRIDRVVSLDGVHGGTATHTSLPKVGIAGGLVAPFLTEFIMNGADLNFSSPPLVPGWNRPENMVLDPADSGKWLLYSCVPDPVVYPNYSACGKGRVFLLPLQSLYWVEEWVRGTRRSVLELHMGLLGLGIPASIPVLSETADFFMGDMVPDDGCPPTFAPDPTEGLGRITERLSAGSLSAASVLVPFDGNTRVYGRLTRAGPTSVLRILDSAGTLIPLENATSNMIALDFFSEGFELTSPPVGDMTVELHAGASSGEAQLSLYFDNLRHLLVNANPTSAARNQQITLVAQLRDGHAQVMLGSSPTFEVRVLLPDQLTVETVTLQDDGQHGDGAAGDGVFGGFFMSTGQHGRYVVYARGSAVFGIETVARSVETGFVVLPTSGTLIGPLTESTPDPNGDGLYDSLVFSQTVSLTGTGSFSLSALLVDGQGNRIRPLVAQIVGVQVPGQHTMTLTVPGPEIARHGKDGPWLVKDIVLSHIDAGSLPTATAPVHRTAAYTAQAFEPPSWPSITGIIPNEGSLLGGQEVVLYGSSLGDATEVLIGDSSAAFTATSDSSLLVTIPPLVAAQDTQRYPTDIRVVTPWGVAVALKGWFYSQ